MALDPKTGRLFVTEIFTGRIVEVTVRWCVSAKSGKHYLEEFLADLDNALSPCIWLTGWTRAQLAEPRR
jgi:hypothetical protein